MRLALTATVSGVWIAKLLRVLLFLHPVLSFAKTTNALIAASLAAAPLGASLFAAQPAQAAIGALPVHTARFGSVGRVLTTIPMPPPVEPAPAAVRASQPYSVALSVPLPPPAQRIYAITPERRALLNTIRYAEGTWAGGADLGYRIMFGGSLMASLYSHPYNVNRTARFAIAAAGA